MHACIHTYTHARTHTHTHTHTHTVMHTHMHTCVHTYIYACLHACMHAYLHRMLVYLNVCVCVEVSLLTPQRGGKHFGMTSGRPSLTVQCFRDLSYLPPLISSMCWPFRLWRIITYINIYIQHVHEYIHIHNMYLCTYIYIHTYMIYTCMCDTGAKTSNSDLQASQFGRTLVLSALPLQALRVQGLRLHALLLLWCGCSAVWVSRRDSVHALPSGFGQALTGRLHLCHDPHCKITKRMFPLVLDVFC